MNIREWIVELEKLAGVRYNDGERIDPESDDWPRHDGMDQELYLYYDDGEKINAVEVIPTAFQYDDGGASVVFS